MNHGKAGEVDVIVVLRDHGHAKCDGCCRNPGVVDRHPSLRTVVVVPLTSNLRWVEAPGNVLLTARSTGLPGDSAANVSQVVTVDKTVLTERIGKLTRSKLELVLAGLDIVLGQ